MDDAAPIEALRNLGPKSGAMLRQAGMTTIGALRDAGDLAPVEKRALLEGLEAVRSDGACAEARRGGP